MADPRIVADPRIASPARRAHPWYRWAVVLYDPAYRVVHGLDRLPTQVGPALCVEVRRSRRARRLPDGTRIASGDRVGVIHLNNARLTAVHVNGQPPDRKSTRLNSSHLVISYAVFCLKKKK